MTDLELAFVSFNFNEANFSFLRITVFGKLLILLNIQHAKFNSSNRTKPFSQDSDVFAYHACLCLYDRF